MNRLKEGINIFNPLTPGDLLEYFRLIIMILKINLELS